ncbi:S-adenosylmethionine-dependent methyltransferase [Clostridium tetani]|uniref:class I SAM-dependent methyltransferase n=1 Tax=Clostridium tetani TaxID=1513 RepID=UPI002953B2B6|nr:methyltransferase domain-containing protein [Clostridium tetani]BDR70552.1 S-adenosylmethionine-dependent methyltransferase [Clostridium tetani]BEV20190.1 methyltransferase domain-containing protein [Clostridium tetani]
MRNYKDKSISSFNSQAKNYDIDSNGAHARNLYKPLIKKLKKLNFNTILDVGCGTGSILFLLLYEKENIKAYGLDISEEMLNVAKEKLKDKAILTLGDSENMPYKDEFFDVVICTDSFHHYPNPLNVLKEIHRTLKERGVLIICDYWTYFPKRQFMNLFIPFSKDGDVRIYSQKEICNLLQRANFKDINWNMINKRTYMVIASK